MPSISSAPLRFSAIAMIGFLPCTARLAARELEGSVSVAGNVVKVQVNYDNQTPATGAKIAIVDAQQQIVVRGHINAEGRWAHDLTKAGSYEVRIDAGPGDGDKIEMPFSISPNSVPDPAPPATGLAPCCQPAGQRAARPVETGRASWLMWVMAIGFIGGCGAMVWASRSRGRKPNLELSHDGPPSLPAERDS